MRGYGSILVKFFLVLYLSTLGVSIDFDFFYFLQRWPGSYCNTKQSCCYPTTGKPAADFVIHGLWPNKTDGSYPLNCDPSKPFDKNQVSDLLSSMEENWPSLSCPSSDGVKFWKRAWDLHGTCSESVLNQHDYFKAALTLRNQLNLLQVLTNAEIIDVTRIKPDGGLYSLSSIKTAIKETTGYTPSINCNSDSSGNIQLHQIFLCLDTSGSNLIECPIFPQEQYASEIEFSAF